MQFPENLKYTATDEWIRAEGDTARLGVTDFAQDQLSDIVYFEAVVKVGDDISKGEAVGILESVKAASDIYSPVTGKVVEINDTLPDKPEVVNSDPYGEAWMVRIRMSDPGELSELMEAAAYEQHTLERSG